MRTITLKSVPDKVYEDLKESAKRNRRSLNQEALFRIEQAPVSRSRNPEEVLESIRKMREEMNLPLITDEFINEAKRQGRL